MNLIGLVWILWNEWLIGALYHLFRYLSAMVGVKIQT